MTSRRPDDTVRAVDLFCGAGGLSWGLARACEQLDRDVELAAVNHWERAIETHEENHPWADHYHAKVEELDPRAVFDTERVDILTAGPQCTYHSKARGGRPVDEQKRASPWHVLDWLQKLYVDDFVIENVKEFRSWGPIGADGTPMKSKKGETFDAWINALHSLGYSVDWDVLNAADYGDATSRERLFIVGRRQHRPEFPEPTHSEDGEIPETDPWRPAAEIIDWSDPGESIWSRDLENDRVHTPLKNTTMKRIAEGIRRYGTGEVAAFADAVADIGREEVYEMRDRVVPARDAHTVAAAVTEPFLVKYYGTSSARPLDEPLDTITTGGQKFALCTPYLLGQQSGARPRSVTDQPVPTIATKGAISKIDPRAFVLPRNGYFRGDHSNPAYNPTVRPLHTVTAKNTDGYLVTPYLIPFYGEREGQRPRTHDVDDPLPTVTATGSPPAAVRPFLVEYYGNGGARSVGAPVPTVTTRDRFALVVPEHYPLGLDIRFRMLKPGELAAAMGFPMDYEFVGNKGETIEQIGNAVPVGLARSLVEQLLVGDDPTLRTFTEDEPAGEPAYADGGDD